MNNGSLLIIDDEQSVVSGIKRRMRSEGYLIYTANSGEEGLRLLKEKDIGVVLSDQMMPGMDGITFLEKAKQYNPDVVRLIITGNNSLENAIAAINHSQIFGYLTKPWSDEELKGTISKAFDYHNLIIENKRLLELTSRQNKELKDLNANLEVMVKKRTRLLETAVREGIVMLSHAAEANDDDTGEHVYRIRGLTSRICKDLGISPQKSEEIGFFSMMHDIGKIHIPDSILKKPDPLNSEEWTIMNTHTVAGEKILGNKPFYKTAREIARSHHERWDGNGYPDGLKGENIPFSARIVTVADVFDALIHERPYKRAWPMDQAIAEMEDLSGKVFDPEILSVFLKISEEEIHKINHTLEMSDGT